MTKPKWKSGWYWARRRTTYSPLPLFKWRPIHIGTLDDGDAWVWNEGPVSEFAEIHEIGQMLAEQCPPSKAGPLMSGRPSMTDADEHRRGDLRVWHIPQVPGRPFHVDVTDARAAADMLHTLALYDHFQYTHKIKPDYANVSGLEVFDPEDPQGWCEWHSTDGLDIWEHMRAGDDIEALVWEADAA